MLGYIVRGIIFAALIGLMFMVAMWVIIMAVGSALDFLFDVSGFLDS